jgi:membrane protease YdiL (CAAX protease family)
MARPATGRLAGQLALAAVLVTAHRRRPPARRVRAARELLAMTVAATSPAAAALVARHRRARRQPATPLGLALLAAYAGSVALCEELLWRAPLLRLPAGPVRGAAAVLAGAGFAGLHLRRDGRRAGPVHAFNTAAWTAATLLGGRLRWPVLAHAAYDLLALSLRPAEPTARPSARPAEPARPSEPGR